MDFLIVGVPAGLVVVVVTEAIKRLARIEGDAAIPVAIGVGIALSLGARAAMVWPTFNPWWETIMGGLLLGLAACGLYDARQIVKARLK